MYARTIGGPSCRRWWRRRAGRALVLRMINLWDARERVGAARC